MFVLEGASYTLRDPVVVKFVRNRNKGVRKMNRDRTMRMVEDRRAGLSFARIARKYKIDRSNVQKRVKKYLLTHASGSGTVCHT